MTDRSRSLFVFGNVFLHLHPVRTHRWSLRWTTTMGLGIAATAAFLITIITGVLLMFYYKPYPDIAYDSIKDIHFVVPTGRFIRNIHRWSANVMVVTVILHMARTFYTAAYRKPREFNWLVGLGLFVVTLGLSFTGYLLPWDQLAYWAITIGANIAQSPRELTDALGVTGFFDPGGLQRQLLLGSDVVGDEALIRFYLLHVMILPLMLTCAAGGPFLANSQGRRHHAPGGRRPAIWDRRRKRPIRCLPKRRPRPITWRRSSVDARRPWDADRRTRCRRCRTCSMPNWVSLMLTVLICVALALVSDAPLKELANPSVPENPAKAPWYFLGLQELVSFSAFMGGIGIPAIVLLGLGLIPFLDREQRGTGQWLGGPGGPALVGRAAIVGLAAAIGLEALVIRFGWLREWFPDIPQLVVTLINPGTILTLLYATYSLWLVKRHNSARAGALGLFTCFLCGFIVLTVIGTYFRGPNWGFYWSPADWPQH